MNLMLLMKRGRKRRVMRGEERAESDWANVSGQLLLRGVEIVLDLFKLLLEVEDVANTAIDWITEPGLSLVGQRVDSVFSLWRTELVEQLGDIARPEDTVHVSKLLRLVWREVRGEDATLRALPPQEFAGSARRVGRRHPQPTFRK